MSQPADQFAAVLLGTAVGDSLGLPAENLAPRRIRRLWGGQWRQRFLFGHGMISDDTEHTLFVAQALIAHPEDPIAFQRALGWKLRFWLLGLPAGIGLATLKAIVRLWLGWGPARSGVRSAGNGPAMRSAIIGAYFAADSARRLEFVRASTRLTHTDPRAEIAAQAVATVAAWAMISAADRTWTLDELWRQLRALGATDTEWTRLLDRLQAALVAQQPVRELASDLGLEPGVTGYAFHSVPVAIYSVLRHPGDFAAALTAALDCGGDADTVGAITGALAGAVGGMAAIPADWRDRLWDWPRSVTVLARVAARLAECRVTGRPLAPVRYCWPLLPLRNVLFLVVVLRHGLRRLLPPY